jgi:hypothetical protein
MCAMNPRLLRPLASGVHPEAASWRTRVIDNGGGTPSAATMRALSTLCSDIDKAGIRSKIYRMNMFVGPSLNAALVPLYRAESRTATVRGNTVDQSLGSPSFDSVDYNETGASSGLKGNGSSKYLNTGINGNTLNGDNLHLGWGLRATQTGGQAYKALGGVFDNSVNSYDTLVRRSDAALCSVFGNPATVDSAARAGQAVQLSSLAVGDLVMAYPSFYRNGAVAGTSATTSGNYPSAHAISVFALFNGGTSAAGNHTDARMNWYSIGLTMTSGEVLSFYNAIAAFNTALSRT